MIATPSLEGGAGRSASGGSTRPSQHSCAGRSSRQPASGVARSIGQPAPCRKRRLLAGLLRTVGECMDGSGRFDRRDDFTGEAEIDDRAPFRCMGSLRSGRPWPAIDPCRRRIWEAPTRIGVWRGRALSEMTRRRSARPSCPFSRANGRRRSSSFGRRSPHQLGA